jgi:hypothetical protein
MLGVLPISTAPVGAQAAPVSGDGVPQNPLSLIPQVLLLQQHGP